jgi:Asp-tRNA(Asn)/Glu-tRNA(Gln) amidotransferase B subunit
MEHSFEMTDEELQELNELSKKRLEEAYKLREYEARELRKNKMAFKTFLIGKWKKTELFNSKRRSQKQKNNKPVSELCLFEPKIIGIIHAFMIKK